MDDEEDKDAGCILSVSRNKRDVKEAAAFLLFVRLVKGGIRDDVKRYLASHFRLRMNSIEMNKNIKNKK